MKQSLEEDIRSMLILDDYKVVSKNRIIIDDGYGLITSKFTEKTYIEIEKGKLVVIRDE